VRRSRLGLRERDRLDVTPPLAPAVVEALWRSGAVTVTNKRQRTVLHAKLLVGVVRAGPHELRTPVYGYPRQPPVVDWTGE
jgi:hypothetical protein